MSSAKLLLFTLHSIYLVSNALNTYEMVNFSYWRSTSPFYPIPATSYGTIQLLQSLRMEFKLRLDARTDYTNWQNIFRIGYASKNNSCFGYGSRYPSLWLTPNADQLNLGLSQLDNCHYGPWPNYPITKGKVYQITIQFNDSWVYMRIDDDTHINERREAQTLSKIHNQHLHVWISTDTTINTVTSTENINDITLSNITIHSWNNVNTNNPTLNPSHYPTNNPTNRPSHNPATFPPTYPPTVAPINSPTNSPSLIHSTQQNTITTEGQSTPLLSIESEETHLNLYQQSVPVLTQENIFFLVSGVLLTTFVCLCMIISVLCCICCPKKKKNVIKYQIPRVVVRDPNHVQYRNNAQSVVSASYRSSVQQNRNFNAHEEANEPKESEPVDANECDTESAEEGGLHIEGYATSNKILSMEENFNNVLNNASAISDIMLNDVINEIETGGYPPQKNDNVDDNQQSELPTSYIE